jgi:hypothetical protein
VSWSACRRGHFVLVWQPHAGSESQLWMVTRRNPTCSHMHQSGMRFDQDLLAADVRLVGIGALALRGYMLSGSCLAGPLTCWVPCV